MSALPAYVAARPSATVKVARLTNFYPLYDAANDQVDRIVPVRRTIFQRIIPRYELSTSETRDQGLGPNFIEVPSFSYVFGEPPAAATPTDTEAQGPVSSRPSPLPAGVGRRIDLWA